MAEHRIFQTYVAQFGLKGDPASPLDPIPPPCVASLDTHDTPTFAGFWKGLDIEDRKALGLIDAGEAERDIQQRAELKEALIGFFKVKGWIDHATIPEILRAFLKYLAMSEASLLLINFEDLWEETRPQNVPGTWEERPNWRGKARFSFEEFRSMPRVLETLKEIDRLRGKSEGT
jgi:4-alpha-glucanotransferase